ncbi:P-loop containing nucleoside triphosphate hydrolase protein, partial [Boletus edulis]
NVIFIGETGSGKSSTINLIIGHDHAAVSTDGRPCTSSFTSYEVSYGGRAYRLWDTPGLNDRSSSWSIGRSITTASSLKRFLQVRHRLGELDLLVLCVRGSRATSAMSKTFRVFCRSTSRIAPVLLAVTHLERAQPTMDAWWQENERRFGDLGLVFEGHACITCLSPHHRRRAAQEEIRYLISNKYRPRVWSTVGEEEYLDDPAKSCTIC